MEREQKDHWDKIYSTKHAHEVSWTQEIPKTSLAFLNDLPISKNASIIDVGGGDSKLVDFLLANGHTDLTVLDISEKALERKKAQLGKLAESVHWIVSDVTDFKPSRTYDVWHDRATFHFLTTPYQINNYIKLVSANISNAGYMIIGTFSDNGPTKCSGLPIIQYSEINLSNTLSKSFKKIRCITEDHETPFHTIQNFLFCSFIKTAHLA